MESITEGTESTGPRCRACGAEARPGWEFCGACGTPLTAPVAAVVPLRVSDQAQTLPDVPVTEPAVLASEVESPMLHPDTALATTPGRGGGRTRVVAIGAASVVVIALLVVGVLNILGTRDRLSSTRRDLAANRSELSSTKQTLGATKQTLATTKSDLTTRTAQLAAVNSQLSDTKDQLTGVKQSLSDAQSRVNLQAGQISTLRTCLGGIAEGLDLESQGDFNGAIAAFNAVDSACSDAGKLL